MKDVSFLLGSPQNSSSTGMDIMSAIFTTLSLEPRKMPRTQPSVQLKLSSLFLNHSVEFSFGKPNRMRQGCLVSLLLFQLSSPVVGEEDEVLKIWGWQRDQCLLGSEGTLKPRGWMEVQLRYRILIGYLNKVESRSQNMDKAGKHEKKPVQAKGGRSGEMPDTSCCCLGDGYTTYSRIRDQVGIDNHFVIHLTSDLNAFSKNQMASKASSEN